MELDTGSFTDNFGHVFSQNRLPNTLSASFKGVTGEDLLKGKGKLWGV